ncbi:MAG: hypothetical protein AAES65_22390 [Candidatus Thiodiazotropha sp. (ex. Lucinoma kazani)]
MITDPGCVPESLNLAAGIFIIGTGKAPRIIGFGVGTGVIHRLKSPILAAGLPPINTVSAPRGMMGRPGGGACGGGGVAGNICGKLQTIVSPTRAAGLPLISLAPHYLSTT